METDFIFFFFFFKSTGRDGKKNWYSKFSDLKQPSESRKQNELSHQKQFPCIIQFSNEK